MVDSLLGRRCKCATVNEATPATFESWVTIAPRIGDKTRWCANVRIRCADCKTEYRFDGLPGGILHGMKPGTAGYMGYGAILPISPLGRDEARVVTDADPWDETVVTPNPAPETETR